MEYRTADERVSSRFSSGCDAKDTAKGLIILTLKDRSQRATAVGKLCAVHRCVVTSSVRCLHNRATPAKVDWITPRKKRKDNE
jgi:hypothetical protein